MVYRIKNDFLIIIIINKMDTKICCAAVKVQTTKAQELISCGYDIYEKKRNKGVSFYYKKCENKIPIINDNNYCTRHQKSKSLIDFENDIISNLGVNIFKASKFNVKKKKTQIKIDNSDVIEFNDITIKFNVHIYNELISLYKFKFKKK